MIQRSTLEIAVLGTLALGTVSGWRLAADGGEAVVYVGSHASAPLAAAEPSPARTRAEDQERLSEAIRLLGLTPEGSELLGKARRAWRVRDLAGLLGHFRLAKVSRTDAILTRHYHPATGQEERERKVTVHLRRSQSLHDLVLDLAHELTHAAAGPTWDPYDAALTPAIYMRAAIEEPGGEVDALVAECAVGKGLGIRRGVSAGRCRRYRKESGAIDREKVRADFYRVGRWLEEVRDRLGADADSFPLLTAGTPRLYSSTGHAPYPLALIREFDEITQIACENTRRREGSAPGRTPASDFLAKRCSSASATAAPLAGEPAEAE